MLYDECTGRALTIFFLEYNELEGSASCTGSSSNEDGDGEPTPCNSPKEVRKSHPTSMSLPLSALAAQSTLNRSQQSASIQRQSNGNR